MGPFIELIKTYAEQINALAAVCALIVGFLSICLTIFTLWLQRQHNFKSLTPIASFLIGDYEDMIEVKLRNTGVGPLIVKRFISFDGNQEKDDIVSWMPPSPKGICWSNFTENIDGRCIPPNHDAPLIRLEGNPKNKKFAAFRDDVRRALGQLTVKVEYKDIYGRNMTTERRGLEWFERHFAGKAPKEGNIP